MSRFQSQNRKERKGGEERKQRGEWREEGKRGRDWETEWGGEGDGAREDLKLEDSLGIHTASVTLMWHREHPLAV